jgi:hypothetical protein
MVDVCTIDWGAVTNALSGIGTALLAFAAFWTIRRDSTRERRLLTPLLTFEFFDKGEHENLGPPGFRHLPAHPRHPALRLSGMLRNLANSSAVDCRLDIYVANEAGSPIHEIRGVVLHNGLAASDKAEASRLLTLDDVTPRASGVFDVGIAGLFSRPVPTGKDYPFAVVFSYKNAFGDSFFTAYALHNGSRYDADQQPHPAPAMVFKGSSSGTFTWDWFRVRMTA